MIVLSNIHLTGISNHLDGWNRSNAHDSRLASCHAITNNPESRRLTQSMRCPMRKKFLHPPGQWSEVVLLDGLLTGNHHCCGSITDTWVLVD